jgi:hypothetical protein
MKKIENIIKSKHRELKEIYKELDEHPEILSYDVLDADEVTDIIVGDIKDMNFRELIRKETIKNKKVFEEELEIPYEKLFINNILTFLHYDIDIYDDIIKGYPNYEEEWLIRINRK